MLINQRLVPLHLIDPNPWQTREKEDEDHVAEIARSILADGLSQIPEGRNIIGDRVQLAFGHTRLAAFKLLVSLGHDEYNEFPVNIKQMTDEQMAIKAFSENEHRRNLNPVERARSIQRLISSFQWTQQEVAERLQIDRSSVSNAMRMLRMPVEILTCISDGTLPVRSAMALLPYCEITPLEMPVLKEAFPDHEDFAALARSGQINSDSIRKQVDEYMKVLHPSPLELDLSQSREEPKEEPGIEILTIGDEEIIESLDDSDEEEIPADSEDLTDQLLVEEQEMSGEPGPGIVTSGFEETKESLDDYQLDQPLSDADQQIVDEEIKNHEHDVPPVSKKKEAVGTAASPADSNSMPMALNQTVLNITWLETGVVISLRKPGEIMPRFYSRESLTADDFPELLAKIGIE